jgi:3-hydroxybutyryl-CoA dehydratase
MTTSFEDTQIGSGATSQERTITEDYVRGFAEMTGDRHPLHLNVEYATRIRFGGQIAHGALLLTTLLGLVDLDRRYLQCFYGIDELRFYAPAYCGYTVHAESEVVSVRPRSDGITGVVTCQGTLVNRTGRPSRQAGFPSSSPGREGAMTAEAVRQ